MRDFSTQAGRGLLACAWLASLAAQGQAMGQTVASAQPTVVREIDDSRLGLRWLLERDPSHPGGPGRLVLAPGAPAGSICATGRRPAVAGQMPAIRAGDRVIVEEDTPVAEARLEAVALGAAVAGAAFEVRLKIGGSGLGHCDRARPGRVLARDGSFRPCGVTP